MFSIDRNPPRQTLRLFGALWTPLFGLIGVALLLRAGHQSAALAVGAVAALTASVAIVRPPLLRVPYVALTIAVFPIGFVVGQIVLATLFYLVVTPIALLARLTRRDPLHLRASPADSFWEPVPETDDVERYYRQY